MAEKKVRKRMTEQEKEEWNELYEFVKKKVLMYSDDMALSKTMVLRLKGLLTNKFIENKNIDDKANYTYKTILNTFKFCIMDIEKGLQTHSFKDESHKFNYILKIVESNINTVFLRMQKAEKAEEEIAQIDTSNAMHTGAAYQRKSKDLPKNSILNDLW